MTIPITFQGQSASGAPQGKRSAAAIQFPNVINLKRAPQRGKQKGKASAAFLGVPRHSRKCCYRVLHSNNNSDGFSYRLSAGKGRCVLTSGPHAFTTPLTKRGNGESAAPIRIRRHRAIHRQCATLRKKAAAANAAALKCDFPVP
jgi:hypothetical protein